MSLTLVGLCGTLKKPSRHHKLLEEAAAALAPAPASSSTFTLFDGFGDLPHFSPEKEASAEVISLRSLLDGAHGVLMATPEYAHSLPGSFKNGLDWLVSTMVLNKKPVWVMSASPSGGPYALAHLTEVLLTLECRVVRDAAAFRSLLGERARQ